MSLIFTHKNCSLISHEAYINGIYKNCSIDEHLISYKIRSELFDLNVPYRQTSEIEIEKSKKQHRKIIKKKNATVVETHQDEFALIERLKVQTNEFIQTCHDQNFIPSLPKEKNQLTNERLQQFLNEWRSIEHTVNQSPFNGGNNANKPIIIEQNGINRIIPANCRFFNTNIKDIQEIDQTNAYDFVILDPPWWNKYVRRSRKFHTNNGYEMLSNDDIAAIAIENIIQVNKTLVAIWCTNAPSMIQAVKQLFLPKWKLKLLATWFWIKITKYGDTICEFDLPLKKQPFERLFIACHVDSVHNFNIPNEKLIFSVPSAIHSHKPPLQDLLLPYRIQCDDKVSSLELFARYLLPACTSIGLEVLQLQHLQLFYDDQIKST